MYLLLNVPFLFPFFCFQIINVKDPNWWQAKHISSGGNEIGLIPSQELEERRKAYVPPEADFVHKLSICGTRVSGVLSLEFNFILFHKMQCFLCRFLRRNVS